VGTNHQQPSKQLVWQETRREQTDARETTPAYRTTELYVFLVMTGAVLAASLGGILTADRGWEFATALTIGYLLSRGLAKSGTPVRHDHLTQVSRTQPPLSVSREVLDAALRQPDTRPGGDV